MDIRILSSLTTAVLVAAGGSYDDSYTDESNGSVPAADIAQQMLLQRYADRGIEVSAWAATEAAFNLALQIAAKIVSNPTKVPDIEDDLLEARHYIARYTISTLEDLRRGHPNEGVLSKDADLMEAIEFVKSEERAA